MKCDWFSFTKPNNPSPPQTHTLFGSPVDLLLFTKLFKSMSTKNYDRRFSLCWKGPLHATVNSHLVAIMWRVLILDLGRKSKIWLFPQNNHGRKWLILMRQIVILRMQRCVWSGIEEMRSLQKGKQIQQNLSSHPKFTWKKKGGMSGGVFKPWLFYCNTNNPN